MRRFVVKPRGGAAQAGILATVRILHLVSVEALMRSFTMKRIAHLTAMAAVVMMGLTGCDRNDQTTPNSAPANPPGQPASAAQKTAQNAGALMTNPATRPGDQAHLKDK
jgi:hypothetical protein